MDFGKYTYQSKQGQRAERLPHVNRSALARAMGVSRSQLSRILNGQIEPPMKMVRKLADALDASLDEVDEFLKKLRKNEANGKGSKAETAVSGNHNGRSKSA